MITFYVYAKLARSMGGAPPPPLDPPLQLFGCGLVVIPALVKLSNKK